MSKNNHINYMGRPKLSEDQIAKPMSIRFDQDDRDRIKDAARKAGKMSETGFVRSIIVKYLDGLLTEQAPE